MFDVYIITNKSTGLQYLGKSTNSARRWKEHCSVARRGGWTPVSEAIHEFGVESFSFELVARFHDEEEAYDFERHMIESRRTQVPNGYNVQRGGKGNTGPSNFKGRTHSDEERKRISQRRKGVPTLSEDHRRELSDRMRGNSFRRGIEHSAETRAKISESLRRRNNTRKG